MVNVRFVYRGAGDLVQIAGDWNTWQPVNMSRSDDEQCWISVVDLQPVQHVTFKFIIDGVWKTAPGYQLVDNGLGDENNSLYIPAVSNDEQHDKQNTHEVSQPSTGKRVESAVDENVPNDTVVHANIQNSSLDGDDEECSQNAPNDTALNEEKTLLEDEKETVLNDDGDDNDNDDNENATLLQEDSDEKEPQKSLTDEEQFENNEGVILEVDENGKTIQNLDEAKETKAGFEEVEQEKPGEKCGKGNGEDDSGCVVI